MDDHPIIALHPEIVEDVTAGLAKRSAARAAASEEGHAIVGAGFANPFTIALIESTVRSALEFAAQTFGSTGVAITLAYKNQIRALIGPEVLKYVDTIVHSLQDVQVAPPRG